MNKNKIKNSAVLVAVIVIPLAPTYGTAPMNLSISGLHNNINKTDARPLTFKLPPHVVEVATSWEGSKYRSMIAFSCGFCVPPLTGRLDNESIHLKKESFR
jgi:hypothetical protein